MTAFKRALHRLLGRSEPLNSELIEEVVKLRGDMDALRLEWADVMDKIGRWASRQAARESRAAREKLATVGEDPPEIEAPVASSHGFDKAELRRRANLLIHRPQKEA